MEPKDKSRATIPRCHECGRPVFSKRELVYRQITFGEPSLWGVRPGRGSFRRWAFHRECWRVRRRREMIAWVVALGILLVLALGPAMVRLVRYR